MYSLSHLLLIFQFELSSLLCCWLECHFDSTTAETYYIQRRHNFYFNADGNSKCLMRFSYCLFFLLAFCPIYIETSGKHHTSNCRKQNLTATIFFNYVSHRTQPNASMWNRYNKRIASIIYMIQLRNSSSLQPFRIFFNCSTAEREYQLRI